MGAGLELVGVGHNTPDWNPTFLAAVGNGLKYLDHLSIHRYFRRGHSTKFTGADYANLMTDLVAFEQLIRASTEAIDAVEPERAKIRVFGGIKPKPIGLIIDEWGVWHDDAPIEDGFAQNGTQRDAVFAAACLNLFHRFARRITMTNIAQVMNCLQSLILTRGSAMVLTPTFHVYEMYLPHRGAEAVRVAVEGAEIVHSGDRSVPALSVSASKQDSNLFVTVANVHVSRAMDVAIRFSGAQARPVQATLLDASAPHSQNTIDQPQAVMPKGIRVDGKDDSTRLALPPCSVAAVRMRLA
jgi:alpha-N-arabinofuranosidase